MPSVRIHALAAALLALPAIASAQPATPAAAATTIPHTQVITINPIGLVFGGLSGDYERKLGTNRSLGAGGSYYSASGFSYLSVDGKYRWYPNGVALRGFSVGATGGLTRIGGKEEDCTGSDCFDDSATAATVGVALDYQWLLGARRNFAVAAGIGAKRFIFLGNELAGASGGLPTARLAIGYAF